MRGFLLWLWCLGPANPLVVRTVQGASRRVRHLWVRMAYLGGLIGLMAMVLLVEGGMRASASLTELAKASEARPQAVLPDHHAWAALLDGIALEGRIPRSRQCPTAPVSTIGNQNLDRNA